MRRPRFTIARWMGVTALLALNGGLVRAFVVQEMFAGAILIFVALQVGLWSLLRSRGRRRRFWSGFEALGIASVLALVLCEMFPDSPLNRAVMSYTDFAANLAFTHLPTPVEDRLDEHWDLFLAVVYFVPEFAAALLGGMIAACMIRTGPTPSRSILREASSDVSG